MYSMTNHGVSLARMSQLEKTVIWKGKFFTLKDDQARANMNRQIRRGRGETEKLVSNSVDQNSPGRQNVM